MSDLRDELIKAIASQYYSNERRGTLSEDIADAIIELLEKRK